MRAIVTGAASGIGKATAARLRADGAYVIGVDIAAGGNHADDWIEIDLSDFDAIGRLPIAGPIDALVHAAGLPPRPGRQADILAVNFVAMRKLVGQWIDAFGRGGSIVAVASKAGAGWRENVEDVDALMRISDRARLAAFAAERAADPVRAYDLSKEALIVWARAATAHLAACGLRANTVSPAPVDTPILDEFIGAFGARGRAAIDMVGRAGTAEEVAAVAAFLARPESGWVRGTDIVVDGGLTARREVDALGLSNCHPF